MFLVFMSRLLLVMLGFCLVTPLFASDFGVKGLIDIPTARMSADGTSNYHRCYSIPEQAYSITYQATPWLEGTFRIPVLTEKFILMIATMKLKAIRLMSNTTFLR